MSERERKRIGESMEEEILKLIDSRILGIKKQNKKIAIYKITILILILLIQVLNLLLTILQ